MAMQTALRRAQAQDEALIRSGSSHPDDLGYVPMGQQSPPLITSLKRRIDCDSSGSSQCSDHLSSKIMKVTPIPMGQQSPPMLKRRLDCDYSGSSQLPDPPSKMIKITAPSEIPSTTTANISSIAECHSSYSEFKGKSRIKNQYFTIMFVFSACGFFSANIFITCT